MKSRSRIVYLVLDVLKPHEPPLTDLALRLSEIKGVKKADVSLVEIDEKTSSLKVVLEGRGLDLETVDKSIQQLGAAVHSVDQVIAEAAE